MRFTTTDMPVTFNRAAFLRTAAASAGWIMAGGLGRAVAHGQTAIARTEGESRIARMIADYDGQGIHRTGTPVDNASADWLVAQMKSAGATADVETFALNRIDVRMARIVIGEDHFDGLPLFDGGATGDDGVSGTIGLATANTEIALTRLNPAAIRSEGRAIENLRRSTVHRAIVAITDGDRPGLSPSNAFAFAAPYGLPVLQVSSEHGAKLESAAKSGAKATVIVPRVLTATTPRNVIGKVGGQQPELAPVVVMTPRSGWWQCASERGGGLACWLEIMRAVASSRPRRPFLFVASSGHELGHFGLDAFLQERRALIKDAAAWIHLGANIGAASGTCRIQASDDAMDAMTTAAMTKAGAPPVGHLARGTVPGGEARNIHQGGGRYVSLLGDGPYFHNLADRWPATVDVPSVAAFAKAMTDVAQMVG